MWLHENRRQNHCVRELQWGGGGQVLYYCAKPLAHKVTNIGIEGN